MSGLAGSRLCSFPWGAACTRLWGPPTQGQRKSLSANFTPGHSHAPAGPQPGPVLGAGYLQPPSGLSPSPAGAPGGLVGEGSLAPPGLTLALHLQPGSWDACCLPSSLGRSEPGSPIHPLVTFPHVAAHEASPTLGSSFHEHLATHQPLCLPWLPPAHLRPPCLLLLLPEPSPLSPCHSSGLKCGLL